MSDGHASSVALIGFGAIGQVVARRVLADAEAPRLVAVAVRSRAEAARTALPPEVRVVSGAAALVALRPDLVVECAGQEALAACAPELLAAGIDVMAASVGALARPGVLEAWLPASAPGRLFVPAGAVAGLDGLAAHRLAGLKRVVYTSTKPPRAWRGTAAEDAIDLDALGEPTSFFEGSAREAALVYPKNANIAATVALAGIGLDDTRVRLVADPAAEENAGLLEAESAIGRLRVETLAYPSANPRTSATTALSLVAAIRNRAARFVI
ncbi:MAG TPA: aspartate dehydrogenase [Geminicoccaceae bacterium]|nr:aspartate dehydrogenase [Geminicoccaceae bacterium]